MKKTVIVAIVFAVFAVTLLILFLTRFTCDSCAYEKAGFRHSVKIANGKPITICTNCYKGAKELFE